MNTTALAVTDAPVPPPDTECRVPALDELRELRIAMERAIENARRCAPDPDSRLVSQIVQSTIRHWATKLEDVIETLSAQTEWGGLELNPNWQSDLP